MCFMKKTLFLIILSTVTLALKAQQSILFKIKYSPDHSYKSNIKMDMNMVMDITGDSVKMNKIKAKGVKLPMLMISTTLMNLEVKSGSFKPDGYFPMIFKYVDIDAVQTLNGKESPKAPNPLVGQLIYAKGTKDGKIQVDSISGKSLDNQLKSTVSSMIDNLSKEVQFPEKPLNIGETFDQEVPLNMPIAGVNMQFTIKIVYKIVKVENGSAFFDLDESMTLNMSDQNDRMSMTASGAGNGGGKLVYSIAQNFATSMSSDLDFKLKMLIQDMTMNVTAKISSLNKTEISAEEK